MSQAWIVPGWPAPPNVRATVSTRFGPGVSVPPFDAFNLGTRCGDDLQAVKENRARLIAALSLPSAPRWLKQVHGTNVALFPPLPHAEEANSCVAFREPDADASITRATGLVLAILSADCLPVLFCSADGCEIAAAHAGWRGLATGVLENALAAMQSPRTEIMAWLGPAIGARSYEVGAEVRDAFAAHDPQAADAFIATRTDHWCCDLYALATQRLRAAGVARIYGGGFDTFADPQLYSYRRDGARSGRFASLIWRDAAMPTQR